MVSLIAVPVFCIEQDEDGLQRYVFLNRSDLPYLNKFKVGDKVKFCSNHPYHIETDYFHIFEMFDYDIQSKQWYYFIKMNLIVCSYSQELFNISRDKNGDSDNWYEYVTENVLVPY